MWNFTKHNVQLIVQLYAVMLMSTIFVVSDCSQYSLLKSVVKKVPNNVKWRLDNNAKMKWNKTANMACIHVRKVLYLKTWPDKLPALVHYDLDLSEPALPQCRRSLLTTVRWSSQTCSTLSDGLFPISQTRSVQSLRSSVPEDEQNLQRNIITFQVKLL